jgi:hypothetical protein
MRKYSMSLAIVVLLSWTISGTAAVTKSLATIDECKTALGPVLTGEYEVVITFSGITLFERKDADGYMNVRLLNAVSGRPASVDPILDLIDSHTAYILTDIATARPILDAEVPLHSAYFEGACYNYYPLKGHVITVDDTSVPPASNGTLCVTDTFENGKLCPNEDPNSGVVTKGSMRWIPSIKTVLGGTAQTPQKEHFEDVFDPSVLSGMVRVDRGYLETVVTNPVVWGFKKDVGDADYAPQAIAQEVRWHMRGKGSEFVLNLKKKNGNVIKLKFLPVNGKVSIFIANNPADETGPIRIASSMKMDHHFRLYYEFIDGFDPKKTVIPFESTKSCGTLKGEKPTLLPCACSCPKDPNCPIVVEGLPSGLNCGATQWP